MNQSRKLSNLDETKLHFVIFVIVKIVLCPAQESPTSKLPVTTAPSWKSYPPRSTKISLNPRSFAFEAEIAKLDFIKFDVGKTNHTISSITWISDGNLQSVPHVTCHSW
jgi:hypothetical protein